MEEVLQRVASLEAKVEATEKSTENLRKELKDMDDRIDRKLDSVNMTVSTIDKNVNGMKGFWAGATMVIVTIVGFVGYTLQMFSEKIAILFDKMFGP
jgi:uncharacterized protein YoxC